MTGGSHSKYAHSRACRMAYLLQSVSALLRTAGWPMTNSDQTKTPAGVSNVSGGHVTSLQSEHATHPQSLRRSSQHTFKHSGRNETDADSATPTYFGTTRDGMAVEDRSSSRRTCGPFER